MPPFASFLPVLLIALAAVAIYFGWQAEKKRRAAFQAWADEHGWSYRFRKDKGLVRRYGFLDRLQQGHSRVAYHRLGWGSGAATAPAVSPCATSPAAARTRRRTTGRWRWCTSSGPSQS